MTFNLNELRKRFPLAFTVALIIHIILLLVLANILIVKPTVRKILFNSSIVSSADVQVAPPSRPREDIVQKSRLEPVKDISRTISPTSEPLAVDRELDMPALTRGPEPKLDEMTAGISFDEIKSPTFTPSSGELDFSSKARISGSGKNIRGKLVFPISTYADWNNDPTTIPNLMNELGRRTEIDVSLEERPIDFNNKRELFQYPLIYMNGHQRFSFTGQEVKNLREYLRRGGFLFVVNDNAIKGPFEEAFFSEIKRVFPEGDLKLLPTGHPIFHAFYDFKGGRLPDALYKGIPMQAYALFYRDRMVVFYLASGDACDAWAEAGPPRWPGTVPSDHQYSQQPGITGQVHPGAGDEGIENAFRLGINVIVYALSQR